MRLILLLLLGAAPSLAAQRLTPLVAPSAPRHVVRLTPARGMPLTGEILAIVGDTVWMAGAGGAARPVALGDIRAAEARGRGMGPGGILIWSVIGGTASGVLLAAACSSVNDAGECGAVFGGVLLSWTLVGGIAAAITGSPHRRLEVTPAALRPYARFPQGAPPGFLTPGGASPGARLP